MRMLVVMSPLQTPSRKVSGELRGIGSASCRLIFGPISRRPVRDSESTYPARDAIHSRDVMLDQRAVMNFEIVGTIEQVETIAVGYGISEGLIYVILVASPRLLEVECGTPAQIKLANGICRFVEMAMVHALP